MELTLEQRHRATDALLREASRVLDARAHWELLSAAHIAGQAVLGLHLRVHCAMLGAAWRERDRHEIWGQALRLALVPLGHALGRLPTGNTGRADVSAFAPMAVSVRAQALIEQVLQKTSVA